MTAPAHRAEAGPRRARQDLRRALLAVSVLDDLDLLPADDAVVLEVQAGTTSAREVRLPLETAVHVIGPWRADSLQARLRLRSWLRGHLAVATADDAVAMLRERTRLLAAPTDGVLHPGPGSAPGRQWVRGWVRGGALDLGLGVLDVGADGSAGRGPAGVLWPDVATAAGLSTTDLDELWADATGHAVRMGALAASRLARDGRDPSVLRPVGGCDVLTLLATGTLRRHIAESDPVGMRWVTVPDRTRGWFDDRQVDRAFVGAAWSATEPEQRGVSVPLLVTSDEVVRQQAVLAAGDQDDDAA